MHCLLAHSCMPTLRYYSYSYRGKLKDTVLDWDDSLPAKELEEAEFHSKYVQIL